LAATFFKEKNMSYIGNNPQVTTITCVGYADFATADATAKREGRHVYVQDTNTLFIDDGTALIQLAKLSDVVASSGGFDAIDTLANLNALVRSEGKEYYATDQDRIYIDDGTSLLRVPIDTDIVAGGGFNAIDTLANLTALGRSEGAEYYATDEDRIYIDDGASLIRVPISTDIIEGVDDVDTLANLTALPRSEGKEYYATDEDRLYIDNGTSLVRVPISSDIIAGVDAIDTLANLTALVRSEGAEYYATDEDRLYIDNGTTLDRVPITADLTAKKNEEISSASDPTVNDDSGDGYNVGQLWVNTTSDEAFVLVDNTLGAAVWTSITSGGGATVLSDLTDVDTTGVSNGEVLKYNSGSGNWEAAADSTSTVDVNFPTAPDTTLVESAGYDFDGDAVYQLTFDPHDFANGAVIYPGLPTLGAAVNTNPTFDTDINNWTPRPGGLVTDTASLKTTNAAPSVSLTWSGANAARIQRAGNDARIDGDSFNVTSGVTYRITVVVTDISNTGGSGAEFFFDFNGANDGSFATVNMPTAGTYIQDWTAPSTTTKILTVQDAGATSAVDFTIAEASVRPVTLQGIKEIVNVEGNYQTASGKFPMGTADDSAHVNTSNQIIMDKTATTVAGGRAVVRYTLS
jgi:hypothetical protein